MELPTVFRMHSTFAGVCGIIATFIPSFFGQVFPSLASPATMAFIVRMYGQLLIAQAPLLYGIRQIDSKSGLRPFCVMYAFVFGGTAAVSAHSDLWLGVVRDENKGFVLIWLGLFVVYSCFAVRPSPTLFRVWSLVHMVSVACVGLAANVAPAECNLRYFLVPSQDAYNTVSRYYGLLIIGMSLLAAAATHENARPAWQAIRFGLCVMFASSGACLGTYLEKRGGGIDAVGGGSLLTFAAMAAVYGTAQLPAPPSPPSPLKRKSK